MKKTLFLLIFFIASFCNSQTFDNIAKNIIYIDFGIFPASDAGIIGIGLNYERMISTNFSIRGGINYSFVGASKNNNKYVSDGIGFPITINFMTKNKNKFEVGIGGGPHYEIKNSYFKMLPSLRLGYRYQPDDEGGIFRLCSEFPSNLYVSFLGGGYHFK